MLSKLKMLFKTWACVAGGFALLATSGCGGGGGSDPPPSIAQQPAALTVTAPQSATFNVTAGSPLPLSYQWLRNGTAIAGATATSYTTPATSDTDNGAVYSVQVSNSAGSVTSTTAVLTVLTRPELSTAPLSTAGMDGTSLTLTAAARGSAPLSFQWQRNGLDIAGATAASYTIPALALADSGAQYAVVVSNAAGSVTSSSAVVTVNPAPATLTQQLSAATRSEGQNAVFTVVVNGSQPITYQWLLNGSDIPGATSASYTTPVLGLANSGDLYSVRITNPAGTVTSNAASLSVTDVPDPPVVTTAPAAQTVVEGQAATFTVAVAGDAPLSYQWLRAGVAITGATASSYTLSSTALTDNAAQFSVRITNAVGTVTSTPVALTVQAYPSPLEGRAWSTAQALEENTSAVAVRDRVQAIDDAGRVTVLFRKSNGTRDAIFATRGTPNGNGVAPSWSAPQAIDVLNGVGISSDIGRATKIRVQAAPAGDVVATWTHRGSCTTATYDGDPRNGCWYLVIARFSIATGQWEPPLVVTDVPFSNSILEEFEPMSLRFNDRGDMAFQGRGWDRSGATSFTAARVFLFRAAGETTFRRQSFQSQPFGNFQWDMDSAGNLLLGAELAQNATTDIVVHRGSVATGFDFANGQVLDTRASAASLRWVVSGLGGQQLLAWDQNNGARSSLYAATSTGPTEPFTVADVSPSLPAGYMYVTVSDAGQAYVFNTHYSGPNGTRLSWSPSAGWSVAAVNLPSGFPRTESGFGQGHIYSFSRDGNALALQPSGGSTATYDARRNQMVTAWPAAASFSSQVLGFSVAVAPGAPLLAANGVGFTSLRNNFDVLPTVAAPNGDGRGVANLWGVYLK